MHDHLRMATDEDATIEGLLVPFDGPFGGKDAHGTAFSARTNFCLDWYTDWPLMYHHGLNNGPGLTPVGRIRSLEVRDEGVWMRAELDKQNQYFDAIRKMVEQGKMYLSSASVGHLVRIDARSSHVDTWPIVEGTLTPTPSNLLAEIPVYSFRAAIRSAGFDLWGEPPGTAAFEDGWNLVHEPLRAVWPTAYVDALPDSSFAYVEDGAEADKTKRHLPYKDADGNPDAAHVRNALARLDQTAIPAAAKEEARKRLVAAANDLGIAVAKRSVDTLRAGMAEKALSRKQHSFEHVQAQIDRQINPDFETGVYREEDRTHPFRHRVATHDDHVIVAEHGEGGEPDAHYRVPYETDDAGSVRLGAWEPVEHAFVPQAARAITGPLDLAARGLIDHVAALVRCTQDLNERRRNEDRSLSPRNLRSAADVAGALEENAGLLRDLVRRADADAESAARAAAYADPAARRWKIALLDL